MAEGRQKEDTVISDVCATRNGVEHLAATTENFKELDLLRRADKHLSRAIGLLLDASDARRNIPERVRESGEGSGGSGIKFRPNLGGEQGVPAGGGTRTVNAGPVIINSTGDSEDGARGSTYAESTEQSKGSGEGHINTDDGGT